MYPEDGDGIGARVGATEIARRARENLMPPRCRVGRPWEVELRRVVDDAL